MKIKLIYIFLLLISCASTQNLTKSNAIEIAENYIIKQGYAQTKIDLKKTEIDSDILDQYQTPEKVADLRHNLLNSKSVYSKKVENGWIIGFEYKNTVNKEYSKKTREGKGILISEKGKRIQMFHENILFE